MSRALPSISQCFELHEQFEMLENIRAHSIVVARVAETLVDGLEKAGRIRGQLPDKRVVLAGALLHDIAKTLCLKTGCHHARAGGRICLELGYPQLQEIVAEHVVLREFTPELYAKGVFGPKEVVFYADKRVRHDQVVSLEVRLDYILERYGDNDPRKEQLIRQNFDQCLRFEEYLFNFLNFHPDELSQNLTQSGFQAPQ